MYYDIILRKNVNYDYKTNNFENEVIQAAIKNEVFYRTLLDPCSNNLFNLVLRLKKIIKQIIDNTVLYKKYLI